eukprot:CAMPEP_0184314616 /NCGR_PEP_ID=MMETSP1049-20130417/75831_1 /TAXON_ID=77928 /ORGANISM="Proteomonas sulcata, Strain CCMP704" /LENGTH=170 /DNA_ID=CAMNT_0026632621 /DNA_START=58 /DNA_END=570 /DNA_ORIENTATION=+
MEPYDIKNLNNRFAHITNISVQKEHPGFFHQREHKILSFDQLRGYLQEKQPIHDSPRDLVEEVIKPQIKGALRSALMAAEGKLDERRGQFSLLGADMLITQGSGIEDFGVSLLEFNKNPDLELHNKELSRILPPLIRETLDIVLEVERGTDASRPQCIEGFEYLYDQQDI